jgi:hypothetical protein
VTTLARSRYKGEERLRTVGRGKRGKEKEEEEGEERMEGTNKGVPLEERVPIHHTQHTREYLLRSVSHTPHSSYKGVPLEERVPIHHTHHTREYLLRSVSPYTTLNIQGSTS